MRIIKTLGLAAVAAMAAMAFVGATSASADTICTNLTIPDSGECPLASRLALPQTITAKSTNATLTSSGIEPVTCESTVSGEAKTNDGPHTQILGLINSLTFTNCKGGCTAVNGGGNIENLPYLVEALALTLLWHVKKEPNGGNLAATLEHCTIFNVSCLFETSNALLTFDPASGATPAKLLAINVPLVGASGFPCPSSGTWNATYTLTAPKGGLVNLTALP
jgi:hypothetical protein